MGFRIFSFKLRCVCKDSILCFVVNSWNGEIRIASDRKIEVVAAYINKKNGLLDEVVGNKKNKKND